MGLRPIMENKNTQLKNYHNVHKRYIFNLSERINKDYIGNKEDNACDNKRYGKWPNILGSQI